MTAGRLSLVVLLSSVAGLALALVVATAIRIPFPAAGEHGAWYASRGAGFAAYMFIWVSLVGGLLMSSAWFDGIVGRGRLLAIHQAASICGVLLAFGHALILIPDRWTAFGLIDLFLPFASDYDRLNLALGTLSFYLTALVSFSFWFRNAIGVRMWRWVHRAAFIADAGALWHGVRAGSDSGEPWVAALYAITASTVVFGAGIRITYRKAAPKRAAKGVPVAG